MFSFLSDTEKINILKNHQLYQKLGWWGRYQLAKNAQVYKVRKGEVIFEHDEPAEAFYLVANGRCKSYIGNPDCQEDEIKYYTNGDSFGEKALLLEDEHDYSVVALNDSTLISINREHFHNLLDAHPNLAKKMTRNMAQRIRKARSGTDTAKRSRIVTIGSGSKSVGKTLFGINLAYMVKKESGTNVGVIDCSYKPKGKPFKNNSSIKKHQHPTANEQIFDLFTLDITKNKSVYRLKNKIPSLLTKYNYLIIILPNKMNSAIKDIYLQSDKTYLLTDGSSESLYQTKMMVKDFQTNTKNSILTELNVLVTRVKGQGEAPHVAKRLQTNVAYCLPEIKEGTHVDLTTPLYCEDKPEKKYSQTVKRIARKLCGVSVGLALGSGAARGLAHIGVLQSIQDDITIDAIAGTSIGAIAGSAWALGNSPAVMRETAKKFQLNIWNPFNFSLPPFRSLLNEQHIRYFLDQMYEDYKFVETNLPLYIVGTNLTDAKERIYSSGLIKKAVRSSISLTPIFPPVNENGKQIVDGSSVNPVPVSVLKEHGIDKVIAVNPIPNRNILREIGANNDTPSSLLKKIKKWFALMAGQKILETHMQTVELMQAQLAKKSAQKADVSLSPVLTSGQWYEFNRYDEFIQAGRRCVKRNQDKINKLS